MNKIKNLVIKIGTEVLIGPNRWKNNKPELQQEIFNKIAMQVDRIKDLDIGITIISSGAIQAGKEIVEKRSDYIIELEKKELAGIGSYYLMDMWARGFLIFRKVVAQVWVTFGNLKNNGERESLKSCIRNYQKYNVVPIVNENDVVSDIEIKLMEQGISENDQLARMVAELIGADAILFLTKSGGVYENDPAQNKNARMYTELNIETALEMANNSSTNSPNGTGGIEAKLKQAALCARAGMKTSIAGLENDAIYKFAVGLPLGTVVTIDDPNKFQQPRE